MPDDNPYQSPQTKSPEPARKAGWKRQLIVGILLLVGMVPAAGATFFCCCLAGIASQNNSGMGLGLISGAVGGLAVFVLMLWGGIRLIRRSKQAPTA